MIKEPDSYFTKLQTMRPVRIIGLPHARGLYLSKMLLLLLLLLRSLYIVSVLRCITVVFISRLGPVILSSAILKKGNPQRVTHLWGHFLALDTRNYHSKEEQNRSEVTCHGQKRIGRWWVSNERCLRITSPRCMVWCFVVIIFWLITCIPIYSTQITATAGLGIVRCCLVNKCTCIASCTYSAFHSAPLTRMLLAL
jgi:hypothetical protein